MVFALWRNLPWCSSVWATGAALGNPVFTLESREGGVEEGMRGRGEKPVENFKLPLSLYMFPEIATHHAFLAG